MQLEAVQRKTGETIRRYGYAMKRIGATALLGASMFVSGCATAATRGGNETQISTSPAAANVTPTRPSQGYAEVEQFGAYTFDNYQNASGKGQYLQIGQQVVIACIEYDPNTTVTSTRGLWYQLVTPTGPRGEVVYAAANTFWNQDPPQPPDQDNAYDARVSLCTDSSSKVLPSPHG